MPKLWNETIDAHRIEVRHTVMHVTAKLVGERGLRSVTMSEIAERSGIGRATLYKYFPDVETILSSWHEQQVTHHLEMLREVRDRAADPNERLADVLRTYAMIVHDRHGSFDAQLTASLHEHEAVQHARAELRQLLVEVLIDATATGAVRGDVGTDELVSYCLHALGAARDLPSEAAVRRLVDVTLAGLLLEPRDGEL